MRLTMICGELPYPPNHGGTADMWRRVCALNAAGVKVRIVCWHQAAAEDAELAGHVAKVREVAESVAVYPFQNSGSSKIWRLASLSSLPWGASARALSGKNFAALLANERAAAPDAIWLDGLFGGDVALKLTRALNKPLFYRSQNIEHRYIGYQLASAKGIKAYLHWGLRNQGIRQFELKVMQTAQAFFDISVDDLAWWQQQGFRHGHWLPTLVDTGMTNALSAPLTTPATYDVGYLGNLFMPNNVFGVSWFVREVVPLLLRQRPELRIFIAGNRPCAQIRELLAGTPHVQLIESPADAVPVLRSARVLINPVFAGSGVNVKSVEMLFTPAHLVSTPKGLAGLPQAVVDCFQVADQPQPFAESILKALQAPAAEATPLPRQRARRLFMPARIADILPILQEAPSQITHPEVMCDTPQPQESAQ
ncbi:glycosyltransferase [Silvimonas iriomotensis]|uniref:Uncharacterized protein n=1 Tax=Silvimonas iriomotensis TaxID=449662 RepID=A0ABQ2P9E0_9NEIS|nr:glycosyltransferase [Silvimonas iriomotensis]GGP20957.1 hypothetical protein GCM10010970_17800 [Silvimonas iriomotensis]